MQLIPNLLALRQTPEAPPDPSVSEEGRTPFGRFLDRLLPSREASERTTEAEADSPDTPAPDQESEPAQVAAEMISVPVSHPVSDTGPRGAEPRGAGHPGAEPRGAEPPRAGHPGVPAEAPSAASNPVPEPGLSGEPAIIMASAETQQPGQPATAPPPAAGGETQALPASEVPLPSQPSETDAVPEAKHAPVQDAPPEAAAQPGTRTQPAPDGARLPLPPPEDEALFPAQDQMQGHDSETDPPLEHPRSRSAHSAPAGQEQHLPGVKVMTRTDEPNAHDKGLQALQDTGNSVRIETGDAGSTGGSAGVEGISTPACRSCSNRCAACSMRLILLPQAVRMFKTNNNTRPSP
jgi:hypothetical protein